MDASHFTREKVIEFVGRRPFQPFAVTMADGSRLAVVERFTMAVGDKTAHLVPRSGGHYVLRIDQMRALETIADDDD